VATSRRRTTPGLGEFLDTLEARLRTLGAEGTITALLAHAQRLPATSRQEFLAIFGEPGIPKAAARDDGLLADIDAFAQRARDGEFDASHDGYNDDWYDDYHDDEYRADAEWVQEADALFAAAGQVFLAGHLDQAREAYHRLFTLFRPSHQGGADLDTWMLATTDLAEAAARYLRCVYDTTPAPQRGPAVYQAYTALNAGPQPPLLRDIATARRGDLPDLPAFLPSWIDALLAETPALSTGQRRRLLTEATLMHRGVDGLADLAHRPGPHQPGTYLDWIDALTDAGRIGHAADAAREALTITPAAPIHLAHAADRLAELATRLRDLSGAVEARRRAWRADPTRERLIALVTTARVAGTEDRTLAAETRHARGRTDRLSGELFLLAGRIDTAAAALTHAPSRGWSRPAHPGPVVLPYLLVAATAAAPPTADTQLGQLFAGIDTIPEIPIYHRLDADHGMDEDDPDDPDDLDTEDVDVTDDEPGGDTKDRPASLVALLTSQITQANTPAKRRRQWLAAAESVVARRVEAIVSNKNRGAYARAASLIVAYAEAQTITGTGTGNGHDYVAGMRQRYPRHTAFRAELDRATRASALAGQPVSHARPHR